MDPCTEIRMLLCCKRVAKVIQKCYESVREVLVVKKTWPLASLADLSMLVALAKNENPRKSTKIHENP